MSVQHATADPLIALADPDVRYYARRALHAGVPASLVAAEIGVTVDQLEQALRPVRRRTVR